MPLYIHRHELALLQFFPESPHRMFGHFILQQLIKSFRVDECGKGIRPFD